MDYWDIARANLPTEKHIEFVLFMTLRFPENEKANCDSGYAQEWAERFKSEPPIGMDDKSLEIWNAIKLVGKQAYDLAKQGLIS